MTAWETAATLRLSQTAVRFLDVNINQREFQTGRLVVAPESAASPWRPPSLVQGPGLCALLATTGISEATALLTDLWGPLISTKGTLSSTGHSRACLTLPQASFSTCIPNGTLCSSLNMSSMSVIFFFLLLWDLLIFENTALFKGHRLYSPSVLKNLSDLLPPNCLWAPLPEQPEGPGALCRLVGPAHTQDICQSPGR